MAHAAPSLHGKAQFGPFVADLRAGELRKHGLRVKLPGRPFSVLAMLLEHPGEVVTRDEIRTRLWPDGTFVDFENNINSAIGKLRAALSDSATAPRYIETVGRGYRFAADVEWLEVGPQLVAPTKPANVVPIATLRSHFNPWLVSILVALIVIAGATTYFLERPAQKIAPANGRVMIAVLPFQNLTGDPSQDYLSDGLTEEIISEVGSLNVPRMGVIARTSVMHYKYGEISLPQVRRELGVQYVMEGGIRRDGDHVRVNAQLIELEHQSNVWSRQYDRELKGLLTLEAEIAQQIAGQVQLTFAAPQGPAHATAQDYGAYDLYLKGQYFFNQRTGTGFTQAINYYRQAIAKDPAYAPAYAGLANCYSLLPGYTGTAPQLPVSQARDNAMRALQLDPNLPEAHAALALAVQNFEFDWTTAEREFRRAIELNPSYATAHHWYAEHLAFRGRFDEALQQSELARQLDPLSLIIAADNGAILYFARRYDDAIAKWQSVLDLDPGYPRAQQISSAYAAQGDWKHALAYIDTIRDDNAWAIANRAFIEGRSGNLPLARHALEQVLRIDRQSPIDPWVLAHAYLGLGENQKCLEMLEKAYAQHSIDLTSLKVDPEFDPLRNDPRFQKLLAKVGLN